MCRLLALTAEFAGSWQRMLTLGLLVAMVEGVHFRGPDYVGRLRLADGNHVEALLGLQPPAVGSTVRLAWNDPAPVFFD